MKFTLNAATAKGLLAYSNTQYFIFDTRNGEQFLIAVKQQDSVNRLWFMAHRLYANDAIDGVCVMLDKKIIQSALDAGLDEVDVCYDGHEFMIVVNDVAPETHGCLNQVVLSRRTEHCTHQYKPVDNWYKNWRTSGEDGGLRVPYAEQKAHQV